MVDRANRAHVTIASRKETFSIRDRQCPGRRRSCSEFPIRLHPARARGSPLTSDRRMPVSTALGRVPGASCTWRFRRLAVAASTADSPPLLDRRLRGCASIPLLGYEMVGNVVLVNIAD